MRYYIYTAIAILLFGHFMWLMEEPQALEAFQYAAAH